MEEIIISGVRYGLGFGILAFGSGFVGSLVLKLLNIH